MVILVHSTNNAPGVIRFLDLEGNEDAVLVSPGRSYRLSVSEVLYTENHIKYTVVEEGSTSTGSGLPVIRRKKSEADVERSSNE